MTNADAEFIADIRRINDEIRRRERSRPVIPFSEWAHKEHAEACKRLKARQSVKDHTARYGITGSA